MAHPEPLPPPPRRRRRRHWGRTLFKLALGLIVLGLAAVQIALWSPLPKRIAEAAITKELGAAATIESVSIGWTGTTHVTGVTITQPMARSPLITIRKLTIRHHALPLMAFTHKVHSITADGVALDLRQDREGEWNVQELVKNVPEDSDPPDPVLELPNLAASDVTVKFRTSDGRTAELRNIQVSGVRKPPLDYAISASLGGELTADGRMALTRDASHEITLAFSRVPDALKPILPDLPEPLSGRFKWSGRRTEHGIDGVLQLSEAAAGHLRAAGDVELFTWENHLVAAPKHLAVRTIDDTPTTAPTTTPSTRPATAPAGHPFGPIVLESGRIIFGDRIGLQKVRARVAKGRVAVDGFVDRRNLTADLTAAWDEIAEAGLGTSGKAQIKMSRDLTGSLVATADMDGSLSIGGGTVSGAVRLRGGGDSLATLFVDVETDAITWNDPAGRALEVPAMVMSVKANGRDIKLASFRPRDPALGNVNATGSLNLDTKFWFATVSARDVRLADLRVPGVHRPIQFDLDAYGTTQRVDVKDFYLGSGGGATYWARGFYDSRVPDPVSFNAWAWYVPPHVDAIGAGFQGLRFTGDVAGTLSPRNLYARGSLSASALQVRGRYIGDIAANIEANFREDRMTVDSPQEIELLGGKWKLHGQWHNWGPNRRQPLVVQLDWKDLPVNCLADVAKLEGFDGMIDSGSATITIPKLDRRQITASMTTSGSKLRVPGSQADTLALTAKLDRGELTADVKLTNGKGTIDSKISTSILEPSPIVVDSKLKEWPAATAEQRETISDLQAYLSGACELKVIPHYNTINAKVDVTGRIERGQGEVGKLEVKGSSTNRRLTLDYLQLTTLDGTAYAKGGVDLQNINGANLDLTYEKLDMTQLAWLVPPFKDLTGRYSGELHVHPSTDRRPLGPITINFHVSPLNGRFRTVDLGGIDLNGFAAYESKSDFRIVSDRATIRLADGEILPFVRLSSTEKQGLTQLINLDFKDLSLEPLVHAFDSKEKKPMPGRLTGSMRLYGSLKSVSAINGEADVRISRSDLVNYKPLAFLYNLMRVGTEGSKPTGEGRVNLRVEQATMRVNSARYFNRGVEVTAFGPIGELNLFPKSNMGLILVGTARPLKNLKLPFFSDADQILTVLQGTVTTVQVDGTLDEPKPKQVFISEFSDALKGVLLGVVKEDQQQ